ncbi:MAG: energy-coupled thiamine transporter ThiT [Clostridiales bacterium]|nr:energy-coupled thiamine transporter ThiT [Clostridiales bacterium]
MNLQQFFESTQGQVITTLVILVLFFLILISGKNKKTETKTLVVCAILVALSVVLGAITLFRMPQGGSVTPFSMVPIVLAGYFYGVKRGVMVGMCVGLMNLIFNPYVIHPMQMLLDYPIAFGALALGAVFRNKEKIGLAATYIFGVICRYFCAVLSGVIFFGAYVAEGFSALTWSLWYNATYLGVEAAVTVVILCIPAVHKAFYRLKKQNATLIS